MAGDGVTRSLGGSLRHAIHADGAFLNIWGEAGVEICRCGTAAQPCTILHADGTSQLDLPTCPAEMPTGIPIASPVN